MSSCWSLPLRDYAALCIYMPRPVAMSTTNDKKWKIFNVWLSPGLPSPIESDLRASYPARRAISVLRVRLMIRRLRVRYTMTIRGVLILAAVMAGFSGAAAQQKPFTIEQVMSAPFPSELTAAPAGGKVAWVLGTRGVRNIFVAEPGADGAYRARQLTAYKEDDGQEIAQLAWTPDAKSVVYTRGGDFELGRENPNPRSYPAGVEQKVWVVSLGGGEPRALGEGHSPAVSPEGDGVAFVQKGQVWLAKLDGSEKATQLIHAKGDANSLRWSPDGSGLAFVSRRGDHSFIGVFTFSGNSLLYLDASVDRDIDPVWSPDGKQIAFIRIPASHEAFAFGPRRAGQPW